MDGKVGFDDEQVKAAVMQATAAEIEKRFGNLDDLSAKINRFDEIEGENKQLRADLDKVIDESRQQRKLLLPDRGLVDPTYSGLWRSAEESSRFAAWFGACSGDENAAKFCDDRGLTRRVRLESGEVRAMGESGAKGDFLIPTELLPRWIELVGKYGVARQILDVIPMISDKGIFQVEESGLVVYCPEAGSTITQSDAAVGQKMLSTQTWLVLVQLYGDFSEDTAPFFGERLVRLMVRAFAKKEDECAIIGDGTSTYFGVNGLRASIGSAGIVTAASGDNTFVEVEYDKFAEAAGRIDADYDDDNLLWLMNRSVYFAQAGRIDSTGRPLIVQSYIDGVRSFTFMGYPVQFTSVLPGTQAGTQASTIFALFGNFRRAMAMGDRLQPAIERNEGVGFKTNSIYYRGKERVAFNAFATGDASNVGAYTAVKTAAS